MKVIKSSILLLVFTFSFFHVNAKDIASNQIIVNKTSKKLLAPDAASYQWYFNDQKLNLTDKEIKIVNEGNYSVKLTDDEGHISSAKITVAVNDEGKIYTIYTIGDSTVQDYTSGYYPRKGWGQVLQNFFDSNVKVVNKGAGGTSAMSFYNNQWASVKDVLQEGDYVFIQFGINDANSDPLRRTEPFGSFQDYLTKFVNETKAKGAHPVLVATLRRNAWNDTDPPTVYDAYHDYPVASRQLAGTLGVPLIDLDQKSVPLMEGLGPKYTGPFMYMNITAGEYPNYPSGTNDNVHFQEMGAIEMAKLVVEEIASQTADTNLVKLANHIKTMYEVKVSSNFPDGAILTRTTSFPEGLTITVKAIINNGYAFNEWQDSLGTTITSNEIHTFVMDTIPYSFYANLDDDPQFLDCAGKNHGTAYLDSCGLCVEGNTGKLPCYTGFAGDTFLIKPVHSGICVEEKSGVKQQNCTSDESQLWSFVKEDNFYRIKNIGSGNFISATKIESGNDLIINSTGILLRVEDLGGGVYQFIPKDNLDVTFDVYAKRTTPGEKLTLYSRNNQDNQKFKLVPFIPVDCNGDKRGSADIDICGTCTGGNTNITPVTSADQCVSAINISKINKELFISPNPFSNSFQISMENESHKSFLISIINIQGKEVYSKTAKSGDQFDIGDEIKEGIYILRVISDEHIWTVKIIKS